MGVPMLVVKTRSWYRAECTDGWTGKNRTDYNDVEKDFGEHLKLQHGGK
jgi:hypothetical protein